MAPKLRDPSDPEEWLRRARRAARRPHAPERGYEVLFEDLCFDASQAAEKAVKAILVHRAASFPKTHSLSELLTLAASAGVDLPIDILDASRLTHYAVTTKFPQLRISFRGESSLASPLTSSRYPESARDKSFTASTSVKMPTSVPPSTTRTQPMSSLAMVFTTWPMGVSDGTEIGSAAMAASTVVS